MTKWKVALLTIMLLLFVGCVDYQESLTLNYDGSGELGILFGMDMSMFDMFPGFDFEDDEDFDEDFADDYADEDSVVLGSLNEVEGVRVLRSEQYRDEQSWEWEDLLVAFDSLEALEEAHREADADRLGTLVWHRDGPGVWLFERVLPFMADLDGEPMDDMAWQMMGGLLGDTLFSYSVTFPGRVLEANVPAEQIDQSTNTVTWKFTVGSMLEENQVLHARVAQ